MEKEEKEKEKKQKDPELQQTHFRLEKKETKIKKVKDLKDIIKEASEGDKSAVRKLIKPFLASNEKLLKYGISGKFGLMIKTYDFYFLTDKRIGDLEINPFLGNLSLEVAFLDQINSYSIVQPYISLGLRLFFLMLYFLVIGFWVNPLIKRAYLRYKKSGVYVNLVGTNTGTLIFFDRERFHNLINLTNSMSEIRTSSE